MNSKQFTTTSGKIITEIMSNKRNICNEYSFNDNSPLYIKKQEPSSKELKLVFDFMERIIRLTSGFWQSLGVNDNLKHLLREQNNSFSILDSENCKILNFYYRSIIISLSQYQIDMLGKQNFYASFYIKNAFERIEEFLTQTLPLFEKNIESVQFNILSRHNKFNSTSRIYKFKNAGSYINKKILEYLNKLESAIFEFEPKNVTSHYKTQKVEKEIEETIGIKKSVLSKIKNFNVLEIQKTESALISETPFTLVSRADNDYILEHDTSKTKLISSANIETSNKVSQKAISAENSGVKSADEAVKNFNLKEQAVVSDVNESSAVKTILNYYDEHFQPSENSNTIGTSSSNFILAICLPILSLIIITALIAYCVKKYNKRKEFSNDQSLVVENIEKRQFIDS